MGFCGGCFVQQGGIRNSNQGLCDYFNELCLCVTDNRDEFSDINYGDNDIWYDCVEGVVCFFRELSVEGNYEEFCYENRGGNDMWYCVEGVVFFDEDEDIEAVVNRLAEDVGKYNFLEYLNFDYFDEENKVCL